MEDVLKKREQVFYDIEECYDCQKKQKVSLDPTHICGFHFRQMTELLQRACKISKYWEKSLGLKII